MLIWSFHIIISQTGFQFKNEEAAKLQGSPYNKIQLSPYCYDATWTLAYALNATLQGEASCILSSVSPLSSRLSVQLKLLMRHITG